MIDWNRLLIRTDRPDTREMLARWEWLIGRDKHPLVMTKFGDWFLADAEERVRWIDLLEGTYTQVADTVADFQQRMVQEEQLDLWFLLPWCYRLHDEGLIPGENQCYGFKIPPRLGAPVELSNVEVANLMVYQVWIPRSPRSHPARRWTPSPSTACGLDSSKSVPGTHECQRMC